MINDVEQFELTPYEKMLLNSCICGDCLVMSSLFIEISQSRTLSKELLARSLTILKNRHPFLRAFLNINKADDTAFLQVNQPSDVSDLIEIEWLDFSKEEFSRSKLINESAKFNSKLFDYTEKNLLWRVQIIRYKENSKVKYVLNFVINLFLSDGLNTTNLSIEWVNILNALLERKECDEMRISLEPTESLHFYCKKYNLVNSDVLDKKLKDEQNRKKIKKFVLPSKFQSKDQTGFNLEFIKLSKKTTSKIISQSKANQIKLTAYFHTLFLYTLKDLYSENGLKFPRNVYVDISANLRIRYESKLDFSHIRCHAAMVKFQTDEKNFGQFKNFWKEAQYVHESIENYTDIDHGSLFAVTHNQEGLNEANKVFNRSKSVSDACEKASRHIECDLVVSNLGKYINDQVKLFPGPLTIKEVYCSDSLQTNPSITPGIIIHVMYWKEEIMVQIGANKSKLIPLYFERFVKIFQKKIYKTLINVDREI